MRWTKGNTHDAIDLIQKAALKLLEKRDRYNDDNFTGLLVRIMKNAFLDEIRKNKGKEFVEIEEFIEIQTELIDGLYVNYRVDNTNVKATIDKMDENCRSLLILRGEGYTYEEIAKKLAKKIGSVMSGLSRCKAKLRQLLDDQ